MKNSCSSTCIKIKNISDCGGNNCKKWHNVMSPSALSQQHHDQPTPPTPPTTFVSIRHGPSESVGHFVFTGWDLRAHSENEQFSLRPIESVGFCSPNALLPLEPWGATTYTKAARGDGGRGQRAAEVWQGNVDSCS